MNRFSYTMIAMFFLGAAQAQHVKVTTIGPNISAEKATFVKSEEFSLPCLGSRKASDVTNPWMRSVSSGRVIHGSPNKSALDQRKEEKNKKQVSERSTRIAARSGQPSGNHSDIGNQFPRERTIWRNTIR